ncbi:MAG TPA: hypothetical protein VJG64_01675 [Candidatus Paceibacterota bacterium]
MIIFATAVFLLALVGIVLLFVLKMREEKIGHTYLPQWRVVADHEALHLKELLSAAQIDLKKVPPLAVHFAHVALHFAAIEFARAARGASRQAHRLADFVSHKHNFQRKETRSEFLKKMSERKNGLPGQGENGHQNGYPHGNGQKGEENVN